MKVLILLGLHSTFLQRCCRKRCCYRWIIDGVGDFGGWSRWRRAD